MATLWKQVRSCLGWVSTMRPPQRTALPAGVLATACCGVICGKLPCSGCGAVAQADSRATPAAVARNRAVVRKLMAGSGSSGAVPSQVVDQLAQSPVAWSVARLDETLAECKQRFSRRRTCGGHAPGPVQRGLVRRAAQADACVAPAQPVPGAQHRITLALAAGQQPGHAGEG